MLEELLELIVEAYLDGYHHTPTGAFDRFLYESKLQDILNRYHVSEEQAMESLREFLKS